MPADRKRSPLWNHFESDGSKKAKCCYCSQVLSIPNQNIGNLGRHMRTKHPTVPLVIERQTPIVFHPAATASNADNSTGAAATALPINIVPPAAAAAGTQLLRMKDSQPSMREFTVKPLAPRRAEIIDRQLITMIAKEYHPLRLVEDKEFRKFLMLLNPSYSLPTRKTLSENILSKEYEKLVEVSKKKSRSRFCGLRINGRLDLHK